MSYAIMRLEKIKSLTEVGARLKHNQRVYKTAYKNDTVNPIIKLNDNNKDSYAEFLCFNVDGKIRKNAVLGLEIVTSFSNDFKPASLKKWIGENIRWVGSEFGGTQNIYDVSLHLDESTPHLHFIVAPLKDGKLNCFSFINGRNDLIRLQDSYAEKMQEFGLERGINKKETNAFHQDFKSFRAAEVERINNIEKEERKKAMKKIYGDLDLNPNFENFIR